LEKLWLACFTIAVGCLQVSMGFGTDARTYMISANWDPTDPHFEVLNIETAKGQ